MGPRGPSCLVSQWPLSRSKAAPQQQSLKQPQEDTLLGRRLQNVSAAEFQGYRRPQGADDLPRAKLLQAFQSQRMRDPELSPQVQHNQIRPTRDRWEAQPHTWKEEVPEPSLAASARLFKFPAIKEYFTVNPGGSPLGSYVPLQTTGNTCVYFCLSQ